jgi:hypothetical protein
VSDLVGERMCVCVCVGGGELRGSSRGVTRPGETLVSVPCVGVCGRGGGVMLVPGILLVSHNLPQFLKSQCPTFPRLRQQYRSSI